MNAILRGAALHLTNGDAAVDAVRRASGGGEVMPWRDILHEGDPGAAPAERARFLAGETGWDAAEIRRGLEERDARLAAAVAGGEQIVLWFEADLYDLLQVLQILDRVESAWMAMAGVERWRNIQEEAASLEPQRLTAEQLAVARAGWAAVCSGDPREVERIDGSPLPGLAPALRRWLEQLPWTTDGLTRSERALLRAIGEGASTRGEAFVRAQEQEERPFLGDSTAFAYLDRLASGPEPLLAAAAGGSPVQAAGTAVTPPPEWAVTPPPEWAVTPLPEWGVTPLPEWGVTPFGVLVLQLARVWRRPEPADWQWDPGANRVVPAS